MAFMKCAAIILCEENLVHPLSTQTCTNRWGTSLMAAGCWPGQANGQGFSPSMVNRQCLHSPISAISGTSSSSACLRSKKCSANSPES